VDKCALQVPQSWHDLSLAYYDLMNFRDNLSVALERPSPVSMT
jgi:hypothetical protein